MSKKMSISVLLAMYIGLGITFLSIYGSNPEQRGIVTLCCLTFIVLQIFRYHFLQSSTRWIGLTILFSQVGIALYLQALDGSFIPQIYFFILIAEIAYRKSMTFSIAFTLLCYLAFVVGVYIHQGYPPLHEISFVIPRMLEYWLFFGFSFISQKLTEQKDAVNRINKRLQSAAVELEHKTLIEERVRLSREIHDTIGHTLTTALVGMEACKQLIKHGQVTEAEQKLTNSQAYVKKGLADVRKAVKTLHERQSFLKFESALKKLIEETRKQSDVQIDEVIDSLPPLTPGQEVAIYRALQEGLTNGLRHGRSTEFTIALRQEGKQLVFKLQDNGTMPERIEYGFGLTAMRERVAFLGGTMEIGRHDGGGCRLHIALPLQANDAEADATGTTENQSKLRGPRS